MKGFIKVILIGMCITIFGFFLLYLFFQSYLPKKLVTILIPMILSGMLLMLVIGPILFFIQSPTRKELEESDPDNLGSWHFRPFGLLVVIVSAGCIKWCATLICQRFMPILLEPFIQLTNQGTRMSTLDLIIVLLVVLLPIIRPIRNFLFYYPKKESNE